MICPLCFDALTFYDERDCADVLDCDCEEGFVGMYICKKTDCVITLITVVEGCLSCEK